MQYHDVTLAQSSTRQYQHISKALGAVHADDTKGSPTFYQLLLHWAANIGQISDNVMRRLRENNEMFLIASGPMAISLGKGASTSPIYNEPESPRGAFLHNSRFSATPPSRNLKPITLAMLHAVEAGEWSSWYSANVDKKPSSGVMGKEIARLGWKPDMDVVAMDVAHSSQDTALIRAHDVFLSC